MSAPVKLTEKNQTKFFQNGKKPEYVVTVSDKRYWDFLRLASSNDNMGFQFHESTHTVHLAAILPSDATVDLQTTPTANAFHYNNCIDRAIECPRLLEFAKRVKSLTEGKVKEAFKGLFVAFLDNQISFSDNENYGIILDHFMKEAKLYNDGLRSFDDIEQSSRDLENKISGKNEKISVTVRMAVLGVIGALIGAAVGLSIGFGATGGIGAIPGAIAGLFKGWTTGTATAATIGATSGFLTGGYLGFFSAKKTNNKLAEREMSAEYIGNVTTAYQNVFSKLQHR